MATCSRIFHIINALLRMGALSYGNFDDDADEAVFQCHATGDGVGT